MYQDDFRGDTERGSEWLVVVGMIALTFGIVGVSLFVSMLG